MPTRDAVAVGVLAALLLFVALNLQAGWVYGVDALLIGLLLVGWISARVSVRAVTVQRVMPSEVFEGNQVPVTLTVSAGRWTRYLLQLQDAVPGLGAAHVSIPVLSPGVPATVAYRTLARRRGHHAAKTVDVASSGLTGLFVARMRTPASGSLTIYPRYWILRQFRLPGRTDQEAATLMHVARSGLEFAGVRDFRDGDALRHVHWRSTARRGTLVVREFEAQTQPAATLLLDCRAAVQAGTEDENTFEDLIRAAASIVHFVTSTAHPVRLLFSEGRHTQTVVGGWREVLDALARLRPDGAASPVEICRTLTPGTPVVLLTPDGQSAAALARQGVPLVLVLAEAESYQPAQTRPRRVDQTASRDGPAGEAFIPLAIPTCILRRGEEVGACLEASLS